MSLSICSECKRDETVWRYLGNCWPCAKARLVHEDANPMVPVDIRPEIRAVLEGDVEPAA